MRRPPEQSRSVGGDSDQTLVRYPGAATVSPESQALLGRMVGGYRIEEEVGRGGMSVVFRAVHPLLGTRAAVKVLRSDVSSRAERVARFIVEARAVASLNHPHIVRLFDLVTLADERLCIVMEYVEGRTLEETAGAAPMMPLRARAILLQLCSALSAVHRNGVIHRDLKAQNVLLLGGFTRDYVKLMDFGLARVSSYRSDITWPGTVLGTPHYMAPEQILGEAVDSRADIYALGVLAFRLLTGALPFDGVPAEVMYEHAHLLPPEMPNVSPELCGVIRKALAKRPEDRYRDTVQLARALSGCSLLPDAPTATLRTNTFEAKVTGDVIRLRFASEDAFRHVEWYELSFGRLFVPGPPPDTKGPLTLVLDVPGHAPRETSAYLLGVFDRALAEKHGIVEGFALGVASPFAADRAHLGPSVGHRRLIETGTRVAFM